MNNKWLRLCSIFAFSTCLCPVAFSQDAFDSTAATGIQNTVTGNYTGVQTQQGGDSFSGPMLHGETDGTIGQPIGGLSKKEKLLRDCLVIPVACEEPVPQGIFPPMPQTVSLPDQEPDDILLPADPELEKKASSTLSKAKSHLKDHKLEEAANEFNLVIEYSAEEEKMRKQICDYLLSSARGSAKRQKWQECENLSRLATFFDASKSETSELLDKSLSAQNKNPLNCAFRKTLAQQFDSNGNHRAAVCEWNAVTKLEESATNHARLASSYAATGWDRQAVTEYRKAISLDWSENEKAEQANCHRKLGELFLKSSHYFRDKSLMEPAYALLDSAAMEARRAVTLNPSDRHSIKFLNTIALEAIAYSPEEIDNQMLLAASYVLKGDTHRAEMAYTECQRIDSADPRLPIGNLAMHRALLRKGSASPVSELDESITDVEVILDRSPENIQLWRLLGHLHEQKKETEKAKECFKKAMTLYWSADKQ